MATPKKNWRQTYFNNGNKSVNHKILIKTIDMCRIFLETNIFIHLFPLS
jgi:hypothetical protein